MYTNNSPRNTPSNESAFPSRSVGTIYVKGDKTLKCLSFIKCRDFIDVLIIDDGH